jgi:hypothetical protein
MKRILVIIAVCCLVAVTGNAQKGKDWAQYGVYKSANKAVTESPAVAFMGDSITENWLKFRKEFFSSRNFAARGISGQTTYQMLARFQRDVVDLKPKKWLFWRVQMILQRTVVQSLWIMWLEI